MLEVSGLNGRSTTSRRQQVGECHRCKSSVVEELQSGIDPFTVFVKSVTSAGGEQRTDRRRSWSQVSHLLPRGVLVEKSHC